MSKHYCAGGCPGLAGEKLAEQETERAAAFETTFNVPKADAPPCKVGFISVDGGFCKIVGQEEEAEFKLCVLGPLIRREPQAGRREGEAAGPGGLKTRGSGNWSSALSTGQRDIQASVAVGSRSSR